MGTGLTRRQRHIIKLASEGYIDKEISDQLSISQNTLKDHWRRIRIRLEAKNKAHVIGKSAKLGII